ncbi:MAG: hypothetical protein U9Q74_05560 [Gemmatimonadota bacterium]|nr:hypothetical protein [Gemmatimonadota bacterium]
MVGDEEQGAASTQRRTAAISGAANALGVGSVQSPPALRSATALAITSTRAGASDSAEKGTRNGSTT